MRKGFFSSSEIQSKKAIPRTAQCGLCGLYKHCKSPKMPPTGKGRKKILFVAEAPGEQEDKRGVEEKRHKIKEEERDTQLVGRSGQLLRRYLRKMGIDLNKDCWKTNAVICRRKGNETPNDDMIEACRPNLMKAIDKFQPNVIVLLGGIAGKSLLSVIWGEEVGQISRWGSYCIPCHNPNAWIIPTFHPSYVMRKSDRALNKIFRRHLQVAVNKSKSKPWKTIPSYKDEVEIIMRPSQVAKEIREMISRGGPIAFDYEANCLKPEGEGVELVSCSVCWRGRKTIAYPWQGEVKHATDQLLKTSMPKIASNIKFEDRWTRTMMGHPVRNWWWDTMLAAHVLNNQHNVTSLKFQSFVLLGVEPYDGHIKPFLVSKKGTRFNRIHEIDLEDLLLYNGLDSLCAYRVAMKQMKFFHSRGIIQ